MKEHISEAKILCLFYVTMTVIASITLTGLQPGLANRSRIMHQCSPKEHHRAWQQQMPQM